MKSQKIFRSRNVERRHEYLSIKTSNARIANSIKQKEANCRSPSYAKLNRPSIYQNNYTTLSNSPAVLINSILYNNKSRANNKLESIGHLTDAQGNTRDHIASEGEPRLVKSDNSKL